MTAWESIREAPRRIGEAAAQARPNLRSISSPPRRLGPASFAIVVVSLFFGGMVGMLALTTELQNQAFDVRATQRAASELSYQVSDLEAQVNRAHAPAALGDRAAALGMVPNLNAVFIDLATGEILGEAKAMTGDEMPALTRRIPPPAPPQAQDAEAPAEGTPDAGAEEASEAGTDPATDAGAEPEVVAHEGTPTAEQPAAEQPAAEQPASEPTATEPTGTENTP